jgi:hypothetical protein
LHANVYDRTPFDGCSCGITDLGHDRPSSRNSRERTAAFFSPSVACSSMSLAERTRDAAIDNPFLVDALRAGVTNYSAAARYLDVDGDPNAVATALRRFADDLPERDPTAHDVRVTMERGVGHLPDSNAEDAPASEVLLAAGGTAFGATDDRKTAVLATGDVDLAGVRAALDALAVRDVTVNALAHADDVLVVVLPRLDAANGLRAIEGAFDAVPSAPSTTGRR